MEQNDRKSIIHRKARVGREDFDARAMSPSKALRLSLAKCADMLYGFSLSVMTVEQSHLTASTIPEALGDHGLLIVLDGATGGRGAVKLDTQFVAALIEVQINGDVRRSEARTREYTRTDAAMMAEFLDAVLEMYDGQLSDEDEGYLPLALRFGDRIEDARVLGLSLEGGQFDLFRVTCNLGDGAKTGVISFILPHLEAVSTKSGDHDKSQPFEKLAATVLQASVTLDTVLARIEMPLRDIWALKQGMILPLPPDSLSEASLYGPKKHLVAKVRLGQLNGQRAVRLISPAQAEGGLMDSSDHPDTHGLPPPKETALRASDAVDSQQALSMFEPDATVTTLAALPDLGSDKVA